MRGEKSGEYGSDDKPGNGRLGGLYFVTWLYLMIRAVFSLWVYDSFGL
jgi:hypothetical protein